MSAASSRRGATCSGRSSLAARVGLLAGSVVISLLLAETALRLHYHWSYSGTLEDLDQRRPIPGSSVEELGDLLTLSEHRRLVYRFKPGLDVVYKGARLRTNALGFRENTMPDPPGDTPAQRRVRLLGIGDSVMFGQGVAEEERYMDLLEDLLSEGFPGPRWQTITLAVPGYNLVTEVEALERYGLLYRPDFLLYGFVNNDLCLPLFVGRRLDVLGWRSFVASYLTERIRPLLDSRRLVVRSGDRVPGQPSRPNWGPRKEFCSPEIVESEYSDLVGEESFYDALRRLEEIGQRLDVPIALLGYGRRPLEKSLRPPPGIAVIDLADAYRAYVEGHQVADVRSSELVLSADDQHPSAIAHRLIAEALYQRLVELGWVDSWLENANTEAS